MTTLPAVAVLVTVLFLAFRARRASEAPLSIAVQVEAIMARSRARFGHGAFTMDLGTLTLAGFIAKKRGDLEQLTAALAPQLAQRKVHTDLIAQLRGAADAEGRQFTEDEARQITEADQARQVIDRATVDQRSQVAALEQEIAGLEAELRADDDADRLARGVNPSGVTPMGDRSPATVTREERTYSSEKSSRGEASFFIDAFAAERGNSMARARLERNLQEAVVEGEVSERATTTASFAGLVVPQYLVDMAALLIRSGRPVANAVRGLPLPAQGMSLIVPRGTTGAAVASQATENSAVQNTDEVWANLTVPVVTVAGQQDLSRQTLERGTPGIDELVYLDLAGAYHAELDRQVINGSGAAGQMLGILQTSGINAATAYGAALTYTNFNLKVAGQIAAIAGVGSGIQPRLIFMHPRRWGWMSSLVDSSGRPLVVPQAQGAFNAGGINSAPGSYGGGDSPVSRETVVVGSMQGLPITTDANVPTTVGTVSEDIVGVIDPNHGLLWEEGDGMPKQLRFEQTLGNQLTVKLVIYGYAAFTAGRYPGAFGKTGGLDTVAGQGQVAPAF